MLIKNLIVLEYSPSQDAFHQQTVEDLVTNNIKILQRNNNPGYLVFGVFESQEACDEASKTLRSFVDKLKNSKSVDVGYVTFEDLRKFVGL